MEYRLRAKILSSDPSVGEREMARLIDEDYKVRVGLVVKEKMLLAAAAYEERRSASVNVQLAPESRVALAAKFPELRVSWEAFPDSTESVWEANRQLVVQATVLDASTEGSSLAYYGSTVLPHASTKLSVHTIVDTTNDIAAVAYEHEQGLAMPLLTATLDVLGLQAVSVGDHYALSSDAQRTLRDNPVLTDVLFVDGTQYKMTPDQFMEKMILHGAASGYYILPDLDYYRQSPGQIDDVCAVALVNNLEMHYPAGVFGVDQYPLSMLRDWKLLGNRQVNLTGDKFMIHRHKLHGPLVAYNVSYRGRNSSEIDDLLVSVDIPLVEPMDMVRTWSFSSSTGLITNDAWQPDSFIVPHWSFKRFYERLLTAPESEFHPLHIKHWVHEELQSVIRSSDFLESFEISTPDVIKFLTAVCSRAVVTRCSRGDLPQAWLDFLYDLNGYAEGDYLTKLSRVFSLFEYLQVVGKVGWYTDMTLAELLTCLPLILPAFRLAQSGSRLHAPVVTNVYAVLLTRYT